MKPLPQCNEVSEKGNRCSRPIGHISMTHKATDGQGRTLEKWPNTGAPGKVAKLMKPRQGSYGRAIEKRRQ